MLWVLVAWFASWVLQQTWAGRTCLLEQGVGTTSASAASSAAAALFFIRTATPGAAAIRRGRLRGWPWGWPWPWGETTWCTLTSVTTFATFATTAWLTRMLVTWLTGMIGMRVAGRPWVPGMLVARRTWVFFFFFSTVQGTYRTPWQNCSVFFLAVCILLPTICLFILFFAFA